MQKGILVSLFLAFSLCAGCGSQAKTDTTPADVAPSQKNIAEQATASSTQKISSSPEHVEQKTYEEVLDTVYNIASSKPKGINVHGIYVGAKEIAKGSEHGEGLNRIGYIIEDISGDGIPELIIGEINHASQNRDSRILLLYTSVNDEAHHILSGWARSRYFLLDDGMLYHAGSSGAQYSTRSISQLSEDGTTIKTLEEYSTFIDEGGATRFGNFYKIYDKNGHYTIEELKETKNERWQRMNDYHSRAVNLDLIPMSEYK